jgi:hypothetical protein
MGRNALLKGGENPVVLHMVTRKAIQVDVCGNDRPSGEKGTVE